MDRPLRGVVTTRAIHRTHGPEKFCFPIAEAEDNHQPLFSGNTESSPTARGWSRSMAKLMPSSVGKFVVNFGPSESKESLSSKTEQRRGDLTCRPCSA